MKIAVFSSKPYDEKQLNAALASANTSLLELTFFEPKLTQKTTNLAQGFDGVCCFVNDILDSQVIETLAGWGIKIIAMRCAGYNNVDIEACKKHSVAVARVPEYSPNAIAEHALALILDLNRNIHRAYSRIRENDYSLHGLMGFDIKGKTLSVIGGGRIGLALIKIMKGFECNLFCHDPMPSKELLAADIELVSLNTIWTESDIISLHCPLSKHTHHMINHESLGLMKQGVMLINTSRGGLIDTAAAIQALKTGQLGYLGLDVYEEEANLFFENNTDKILLDDNFARLTTFKNVVITGHQAFFTQEALQAISNTTISNLLHCHKGEFDKIFLV